MNKKIIFLIIMSFLILPLKSLGRSYPVKEISKIQCKFIPWSDHTSDCKQNLPIIENANYDKYKKDVNYRIIYSVLWSSTYKNGWDVSFGSHLGVDITSAKGTPVYSIGKGTVTTAGWLAGRGNTVVIKHEVSGKNIHSIYAHLDSVSTTKGNSVNEGDKIGEIGSTGNSTGNHLHFQIDTNQNGKHPYYHNECSGSVFDIVNKGLCYEYVTKNTIDPIYFLETNGAGINFTTTQDDLNKIAEKLQTDNKINPNELESKEELKKKEIKMFLDRYQININSKIPSNVLKVGQKGFVNITFSDNKKRNYKEVDLPEGLEILFTNSIVDVFPKSIRYIDSQRKVDITGKSTGTTKVYLKMGENTLKSLTLRIITNETVIDTSKGFVKTFGNHYIGSESWGVSFMRDKTNLPIISVPYKGNYILKGSENILICPIKISIKNINKLNRINCNYEKATQIFNFNYKDTLNGILLFKILPIKTGKIELKLFDDKKSIIGEMTNQFVNNLKDINEFNVYYNYVMKTNSMLISKNKSNGYFAPTFELDEVTAIQWIKNSFPSNIDISGNKYKTITRLEFIKLINNLTGIISKSNSKNFLDTKDDENIYANILVEYNAKFLDQFGEKYFQPNKKILRDEAAYILAKLKKM